MTSIPDPNRPGPPTATFPTATFPTVEAALNALGQKVLGASIVIAAAPEPEEAQYRMLEEGEEILITDEWLDDMEVWRKRVSVIPGERPNLVENGGSNTPHRRLVVEPSPTPETDRMVAQVAKHDEGDTYDPQKMVPMTFAGDLEVRAITAERKAMDLEAETERLHALWHQAETTAQDQRGEVDRLVRAVKDLAVGNASLAKQTNEARAGMEHYRDCWEASAAVINKVTAERNELHEWKRSWMHAAQQILGDLGIKDI